MSGLEFFRERKDSDWDWAKFERETRVIERLIESNKKIAAIEILVEREWL